MPLTCPKCSAKIKASSVRNHFACANCNSRLKGKTTGPAIAGIVLWILLDFPLCPLVYSTLGGDFLGPAVRIALSGIIGIPLVLLLIREFGSVEVDEAKLES